MTRVPVCLSNNQVVHTEGEIVEIWTVAPILDRQLRPHKTTVAVRSLKTGMRVAAFEDKRVALNFAGWLWRNYGDITQTLVNSYNKAETAEDAVILDEIDVRANHTTRLRKSTHGNKYPGYFDK